MGLLVRFISFLFAKKIQDKDLCLQFQAIEKLFVVLHFKWIAQILQPSLYLVLKFPGNEQMSIDHLHGLLFLSLSLRPLTPFPFHLGFQIPYPLFPRIADRMDNIPSSSLSQSMFVKRQRVMVNYM